MSPDTIRQAIDVAKSSGILSETQLIALRLATEPTSAGNDRSIRGICKGLGISHQSFYRALRRAGLTIKQVAEIIDGGF